MTSRLVKRHLSLCLVLVMLQTAMLGSASSRRAQTMKALLLPGGTQLQLR